MFIIPGFVISLLTFPGVMLHEWSHKFFCDRAGIPVYEVKYFRFGNPAGYVRHGEITRYRDAFLVTIAPFLMNSLLAMIMFLFPILYRNDIVNYVFMWLGISFGLHAFPSDGDAKNLWGHTKRMWRRNPVALLGLPVVIVIIVFNLLSKVWFDVFYAFGLFFLTLILVYAAVAAGSPYVPGLSSIHVVPLTELVQPYAPLEYHHTSAVHASPTAMPALPVQTAAGSEAPAKDWLPVAQDAMKSKNSNAVLINVDGRSNDGGVALPINGKCHVWKYVYASQPDDLVYDVIVRDGKLESVKTRKLSQTSVEKILYSYGDPTIASWNADSADAASISRDELKKLTGLDSPAWAIYALELSCWGKLTWTVYNFDANSRVIADIGIDEERGILANSWLAPTVTPGTVETPRPTRVPDTRGEESSAKDWLPLADDAMEQEDSNAVLIYVHGYSSDHGTVLPVNGMSHEWWYQYAVPGQNTVYDIYVHDGEVRSLEEGTTKNGNVPIGNWAMDSVDAVTVAGAKFKEMTGNDPLSVAYVLEGSFVPAVKGKPTWNVCYYDAKTKVIANIQVSLETGAVVYTWMPPA